MYRVFLLTLLLLAACAPSTQVQTFIDPSLKKADLIGAGITVMPTALGKSVQDANIPELRRQLAQYVTTSLEKSLPGMRVVPLVETLDALQKANLVDAYAAVTTGFEQTGLLNASRMAEIAKALNARFLLIPYLQSASSRTIYSGLSTSVENSAIFTYIIWDANQSKSVFEGSGAGFGTQTIFGGRNIIDAIYGAVDQATAKVALLVK